MKLDLLGSPRFDTDSSGCGFLIGKHYDPPDGWRTSSEVGNTLGPPIHYIVVDGGTKMV